MKRTIEINGSTIKSPSEFHTQIAAKLSFPSYYGQNADALWDCLTELRDLDFSLVWKDHNVSAPFLGEEFSRIISLFDDLKKQRPEFDYSLR